jgi:hypothetical protein
MKFTTKPGEKKAGTSDKWLSTFKDGDTVVRFLQNTNEMREYWEHWVDGGSVPCTGDKSSCPACTSDNEAHRSASRKYGVTAIDRASGYTRAYKIPVSLYNRLVTREQRNDGSLTTRDYIVIRSGTGFDTEYDVDQGDKYDVDLDDYELFDIDDILTSVWESKYGDSVLSVVAAEAEPEEDKPPFEEAVKSGDEEVIDEAKLFTMTVKELTELVTRITGKLPASSKKTDLINAVLENASS